MINLTMAKTKIFSILVFILFFVSVVNAELPKLILNVNTPYGVEDIIPNDNIILLSEVFNLGEMRNFDIFIYYYVYDSNNTKIFEEHETGAIETRASFVKKINTPSVLGNYTAKVSLFYQNKEITNSTIGFEVVNQTNPSSSSITGASINEIESQFDPLIFGMVFFMIFSLILIVYILVDKKINK